MQKQIILVKINNNVATIKSLYILLLRLTVVFLLKRADKRITKKKKLPIVNINLTAIIYSLMMCVLNEFSIARYLDVKQDIMKMYIIPTGASVLMGGCAFGAYELFSFVIKKLLPREYFANLLSVLGAMFVAVVVYAVGMVKTKGVTEDELMSFPKGSSIVRLLKKMHVLTA